MIIWWWWWTWSMIDHSITQWWIDKNNSQPRRTHKQLWQSLHTQPNIFLDWVMLHLQSLYATLLESHWKCSKGSFINFSIAASDFICRRCPSLSWCTTGSSALNGPDTINTRVCGGSVCSYSCTINSHSQHTACERTSHSWLLQLFRRNCICCV